MRAIGAEARAAARVARQRARPRRRRARSSPPRGSCARARAKSSPPTRATSPRRARKGLAAAFLDRLTLDPEAHRGDGARRSRRSPPCPIRSAACWRPSSGRTACMIERVATPLGVVGVIYESRPNVTADAGALCLKSGNAVVLRGGSDSFHSSAAIHACLVAGLARSRPARGGDLARAVRLARGGRRDARRASAARSTSSCRAAARAWSSACSARRACRCSPISRASCTSMSTAPPTSTRRIAIVVNSKMRRTGVCGAAETLLVDRAAAPTAAAAAGRGADRGGLRGARRRGDARRRRRA